MTGLTITQQVVEVVIQPATGPQLVLSVPAAPQIVIAPVGAQGPQGPSAETITVPAIGAISALRVVARGLTGVEMVSPSDAAQLARTVGVTVNAAADGDLIAVRQLGLIADAGWSWTPGQPLFCGASGVLTATPPTSVAIRQIAVAVDATTILVHLSDLISME